MLLDRKHLCVFFYHVVETRAFFAILFNSWRSTFTFMSMHVLTCFLYLWKLYVNNFPRIFKTENDEVAIYWDNKHSLISIWFQQRSNFHRPKIIGVLAYNLIFSVSIKRPCTSFLIEYHVVSASSFKISYVHICCLLSMFLRWNIKDASDTYTHFFIFMENHCRQRMIISSTIY